MTAIDPYRTLGLTPGASQAEIKIAYRRLAKLNHPDSAGERALPRFLAIQAAYEALVADSGGFRRSRGRASTGRPAGPPAPPWEADASRARATREAYRARNRGARGPADPGTAGARPSPGSEGPSAGPTGAPRPDGRGSSRGSAPNDAGAAESGARARRSGRRPKATIGSTSYDGADKEPFDPAWEGATWYGAGSGTYWTLNPKEYADPRKHGPEYLARSRRGLGHRDGELRGEGFDPLDAADLPEDGGAAEAPTAEWAADGRPASTGAARRPASTGSARGPRPRSGRPAAAQAADGPASSPDNAPNDWPVARRPAGSHRPPDRPPTPPLGGSGTSSFRRSSSAGHRAATTLPGRIGIAVLGSIPLAIGLAALSAALPVCSGVGVTCSDPLTGGVWLVDLLLFGLLVALPRLGWIAAIGSIAFFVGGLLATSVLIVVGGARTSAGTAAALTVVLIAAWLGGVALALLGRVEGPPWGRPRVR